MIHLWIRSRLDSHVNFAEIETDRVTIGSAPENHIVLQSALVPPRAMLLLRESTTWFALPLSSSEILVDQAVVRGGQRIALHRNSQIDLYPFRLDIDLLPDAKIEEHQSRLEWDQRMSELVHRIHMELLAKMNLDVADADRRNNRTFLVTLEHHIQHLADMAGLTAPSAMELTQHIVGTSIRQAICGVLSEQSRGLAAELMDASETWHTIVTSVRELENDRRQLIDYVMQELGIREVGTEATLHHLQLLDQGFWDLWASLVTQLNRDFVLYLAHWEIKKQIKDSLFGYGPLEDLLRHPSISEIMVVSKDKIYIEQNGVIENSGRRFVDDKVTRLIIERIVQRVNRRIDQSQPLVDARLSDGSRVNAVIPPLAVSGPCLTIRKFPNVRLTMDRLVRETKSLSRTAAEFLQAAVRHRCNIVISGGTGSGKTTLLNCLGDSIPDRERIVTVEDTAELQMNKQHVVRLETRPPNMENKGEYTIRDLVKNALRMRPDRIVIGECRGAEALDMLQAMNTGHDGSLTSLHANSPSDAMARLETLVSMGSDLPISSIRRQVASAIDLVVQIQRDRDGRRRVSQISEVIGVHPETGEVRIKDLFSSCPTADGMQIAPTGYLPSFIGPLIADGELDLSTFYATPARNETMNRPDQPKAVKVSQLPPSAVEMRFPVSTPS